MKISIIIPAYNEEKRIKRTLSSYSEYFESLRKKKVLDYEILIIINNTTDKTESIVKKFTKKNNRILCLNFKQGGKGFAVIEGFKDALKRKNDLLGFVDADMSTKPDAFHDLLKRINNYDGIIASRYLKGAKTSPPPTIQRIIVSRIFNILARFLFLMPYRDTQCGAKIFKRKAIQHTLPDITMSQWAFDIDLLYNLRKNNFTIKEVPTTWSDREYSKINFMKAGPMMALGLIRLRLLNSPFKKLIRFYEFIIRLIKK